MEQTREKKNIFGSMSYEKYFLMNVDERREAIRDNVKNLLGSVVKDIEGNILGQVIREKDKNQHDITAEYTLIDSKLNKHGKLYANLICQRVNSGISVEVLSITHLD